jgi:pimeloyl-ACP methyl ester carboxylesterase
MISDHDLAALQLAAYEYPDASGVVTPFDWSWQTTLKTRPAGYTIVDGHCVIILPGTEDWQQWLLDFDAVPFDHPTFGPIHSGGWVGIEAFCDEFVARRNATGFLLPIVIIGHSLGGMEAPLVAAELLRRGIEVARLVCFAPPRCGTQVLGDYIARIDATLYRTRGNIWPGHDIVTDVPTDPPYKHVDALTDVTATPLASDAWEARYHHMPLYAGAI